MLFDDFVVTELLDVVRKTETFYAACIDEIYHVGNADFMVRLPIYVYKQFLMSCSVYHNLLNGLSNGEIITISNKEKKVVEDGFRVRDIVRGQLTAFVKYRACYSAVNLIIKIPKRKKLNCELALFSYLRQSEVKLFAVDVKYLSLLLLDDPDIEIYTDGVKLWSEWWGDYVSVVQSLRWAPVNIPELIASIRIPPSE